MSNDFQNSFTVAARPCYMSHDTLSMLLHYLVITKDQK